MKLASPTASSSVHVLPIMDKFEVIEDFLGNIFGREDSDDGFFVCDLGDILVKHMRWMKNFPRVHPHYAIKCNPNPVMLKLLLALGAGFDCASKAELKQMLTLGAEPDQIIFAHPCKQQSHIRYARDNNVNLTVFDSEEELLKMKKNFPTSQLALRIQTDDSTSLCPLSMKYGARIEDSRGLIKTAYKMDFKMVGISFHVGSGCQDPSIFIEALRNARMLFDYAETLGYHFTLLDIGGGFPGTDSAAVKFEEIAAVVNEQLELLFPVASFPDLRVIAEPGRFYAASAFTLVTNVIAKRRIPADMSKNNTEAGILDTITPKDRDQDSFMYYINDGLYGAFNCIFYDHVEGLIPKPLKSHLSSERKYPSSMWGPTCDGMDKILDKVNLPELDVMEWLVWEDMGAYTISSSSSFNGFRVTHVHYVISEKHRALLRNKADQLKLNGLHFVGDFIGKDDLCDKAAMKLALLSSEQLGSKTGISPHGVI